MARLSGTWLSDVPGTRKQGSPGGALGLPASGPGSLATTSERLVALLIDALLSWSVAMLIAGGLRTGYWSTVVFLAEYVLLILVSGQSAGMRIRGLRVVRLDGQPLGAWVFVRAVLMALVIPMLFLDQDGRGVHDRASGSVVVRA